VAASLPYVGEIDHWILMPTIDLPADSLGPKPTKKQMETLTLLAKDGVVVHEWSGVRLDWHANIYDGDNKSETLNLNTLHKFVDWGWLEKTGEEDWKSRNYKVSDRGRKVIEKGEIRK
jgi:hypothetical protein